MNIEQRKVVVLGIEDKRDLDNFVKNLKHVRDKCCIDNIDAVQSLNDIIDYINNLLFLY